MAFGYDNQPSQRFAQIGARADLAAFCGFHAGFRTRRARCTLARGHAMTEPRSDKSRLRHFSMIRDFQVADLITLGNGFAGTGAILALMKYLVSHDRTFLWLAFALLPVALVMDFADGRVARARRESSLLGQELDSLADCVSFGVAPATLGFVLGMRGGWDALVLIYFVGCGISRLARYNATASSLSDDSGKVKYFEGTPIPTSLALVAVLAACAAIGRVERTIPLGSLSIGPWDLHPLVLMYLLSGSAMVSKTLRIPKP
jgi:CDP-diacylglycerol--serine O-phosphatidyltransferase